MRTIVVPVPGSKSDALRALVLAALAEGTTVLSGAPGSGDTRAAAAALRGLGVRIAGTPGRGVLRVRGTAGRLPGGDRRIGVGGSAAALRTLACVAALRGGRTVLRGDASLRRRPAGPLAAALAPLGVPVRTRGGRAPVSVEGPARPPGRAPVVLEASATSQVASGLLLAGCALPGGLRLRLRGPVVSAPYLDLTVRALRRAGVPASRRGRDLRVAGRLPRGGRVRVEADWSSAAYPLLAAAVLGRSVRVPGLDPASPQADRAFLRILRAAGVRCGAGPSGAWCRGGGPIRPFDADLRDCPDLAPAAAALAVFAAGRSRVRGAAHLRGKESDRIASCVAAARALGASAEERRDGFVVEGGTPVAGTVDSRGDHRVALAFLVAAAAVPGARVRGVRCVAKSWPGAPADLAPLLRRGPARAPGVSFSGTRGGGG